MDERLKQATWQRSDKRKKIFILMRFSTGKSSFMLEQEATVIGSLKV